ncbi:MAG: translesion error-prone DNA polymerase V autoproteolytic subunit [Tannerella sp.]|jgi:DNA polymerase V|nr:translesion error-prone DNA polymerase V autoproteolytic subunit [Tannerella sp.]
MTQQTLDIFPVLNDTELLLPFIDEGIKAGFPSPAQDYIETGIDLNKHLIRDKSATFFARVDGDSMYDADFSDGDIIVIDRSLAVKDGDKVIACVDGDFTLKSIKINEKDIFLIPANPDYETIKITPDNQLMIWGVVTYIIKKVR